ncbi:NAD(P)-dependent dehydrogenase [Phanerochaete sordida]|uniref:NAD(P)-dependent dehydrogenase n=1 Tax=Phanerochaete sordida TaxID=48140 RepID=A0A9P3FY57_9APHY|nr:NAD(P)-dependent dehydrogenase [Phanerochaete sordida]
MSAVLSNVLPDTTRPATLLSGRFRFDQIPDMKGRVAIVTGASAGIGYYTALPMARAGATVVILSANEEKGHQAEADINKELKELNSYGSVTWRGIDLGHLGKVDELAKQLASELDRLDIFVANAGIGQAPYGLTDDGLERHFEVNNLANFVLILRLLPIMKKTAQIAPPTTVRIVMQSSEMHRFAPSETKFASKEEINKERDGSQLYGRTKLGNILFARELAKRHLTDTERPIIAISVHPGTVDTDVQSSWTESYGPVIGKILEQGSKWVGKTAPEGAEAGLWAAVSTDIFEGNWKDFQGNYYSEAYGKPHTETDLGKSDELGNNFWNLCSQLTQEIIGEKLE